ncbi:MAG: alpha/beta hydrolase [Pseudomonadales bacterium]|nr:alpha/beta hydrolase [Pseudomonadales bacterium]
MKPTKLIFLPGAGGNRAFWMPVSNLLNHSSIREFIEWPGIGGVEEDSSIKNINDLADSVTIKIDQPTAVIAQSMGGVVGLLSILKRPELVTHLVLVVTSGGIPVDDIRSEDWRPEYIEANPSYPDWFTNYTGNLTDKLMGINIPVLLIWGDSDPISPVSIGEKLDGIFPNSHLEVITGGDHGLANTLSKNVAPLIQKHLNKD